MLYRCSFIDANSFSWSGAKEALCIGAPCECNVAPRRQVYFVRLTGAAYGCSNIEESRRCLRRFLAEFQPPVSALHCIFRRMVMVLCLTSDCLVSITRPPVVRPWQGSVSLERQRSSPSLRDGIRAEEPHVDMSTACISIGPCCWWALG